MSVISEKILAKIAGSFLKNSDLQWQAIVQDMPAEVK